MTSFPTEFPQLAAQTLIQGMLHSDKRDSGRMALAGYELLGFGLFKYFGDVKYMMQDAGEMEAVMASAPPEIKATFEKMQALDPTQPIPDWAIPLITQAVQWLITTLIERLNKPKPKPVTDGTA